MYDITNENEKELMRDAIILVQEKLILKDIKL